MPNFRSPRGLSRESQAEAPASPTTQRARLQRERDSRSAGRPRAVPHVAPTFSLAKAPPLWALSVSPRRKPDRRAPRKGNATWTGKEGKPGLTAAPSPVGWRGRALGRLTGAQPGIRLE